ncbi:hypothetical protein BDN71DRAFT_1444380 [Pleurotus eryngii]|uniref:Uncharacterized protein n=1 Tax=Pleurotus eryngii TaxID=5323 RepID=A0A9P6DHK8_PLEER|nr:hypothetical protein BDN71DRAFT_1444380 [Pleurotus eryngii]
MGRREYTNWILYDLEITPPKSLSFGQPEYFPPASYHAMQIGRAIYPAFAAFVGAVIWTCQRLRNTPYLHVHAALHPDF